MRAPAYVCHEWVIDAVKYTTSVHSAPVSIARIRFGSGKALFRIKNSASSLVNMSLDCNRVQYASQGLTSKNESNNFVTAAMEYLFCKKRHKASYRRRARTFITFELRKNRLCPTISAVLPDPTGLQSCQKRLKKGGRSSSPVVSSILPSDANGISPFLPVSLTVQGSVTVDKTARVLEMLMGVTMFMRIVRMGMRMRQLGAIALLSGIRRMVNFYAHRLFLHCVSKMEL